MDSIYWIRFFAQYCFNHRCKKSAVFRQCCFIASSGRSFDSILRRVSEEFQAADEDAVDLGGLWFDREWENVVNERSRHDINQACAFFEPGIFPGFEHGVSFFGIKSAGNERRLEIGKQGIERGILRDTQNRWIKDRAFAERVDFAKAD